MYYVLTGKYTFHMTQRQMLEQTKNHEYLHEVHKDISPVKFIFSISVLAKIQKPINDILEKMLLLQIIHCKIIEVTYDKL